MTSTFLHVPRGPVGIREALREWILERRPDVTPDAIDDHTPLIEARYLESVDVPELLLFVEQLSGTRIEIEALTPAAFRDIDAIQTTFFREPGR
jgi:acyl carrier protein